ncbi:cytochrome P450 [Diaporthe amygdali]|uniref:cytochrome P450 n=1 Tax=Phomopsis amygdali TaxID=1214568 RepID=UPI0022FEDD9A|nr:cytochrome P450 [Diaporthe amygdali]KAJ0108308.1 cytochrome P450 [Diaporthe amygdali]
MASPFIIITARALQWAFVFLNLEKAPIVVKSFAATKGVVDMTAAPAIDHARVRKAWAYPFSGTALLDQERLMLKHIDGFVEVMRRFERNQEAFDIPTWFGLTTFDIIGELAFAEPFGCLTGGGGSDWVEAVSKIGQTIAYQQATRRLIGADTWLQKRLMELLLPKSTSESRCTHISNSKKKTLARIADTEREHKDFLYYVLKNAKENMSLSEDEILANAALMIGAGSDATGIAISVWMNSMLRHKTAYEKLTTEIRTSFESESQISWATVKDLPYLGACMNEAMRFHTPVSFPLMRWTPPEGCNIDGHWVPGDTSISVATWASTHSPLNYRDPDKFVPERWLQIGTGQGPYCKDNRAASQPFGLGPRGCLGRNLSMIEQRLIICRLLWNFDVEFDGGDSGAWQWDPAGDFKHMRAFAVWKKPPLIVRLKEIKR